MYFVRLRYEPYSEGVTVGFESLELASAFAANAIEGGVESKFNPLVAEVWKDVDVEDGTTGE